MNRFKIVLKFWILVRNLKSFDIRQEWKSIFTLIKIFLILSLRFFESRHQVAISPCSPPEVGSGAPACLLMARSPWALEQLVQQPL